MNFDSIVIEFNTSFVKNCIQGQQNLFYESLCVIVLYNLVKILIRETDDQIIPYLEIKNHLLE